MTIRQDIRSAQRHGISPHSFISNVAAVKYGARQAALSFYDELGLEYDVSEYNFDARLKTNEQVARQLVDYFRNLGIDTSIVFSADGLPHFYFSKGLTDFRDRIAEINGLYRHARKPTMMVPSNNEYREALREEGRLLGYPECCTEMFIEERTRAFAGYRGVSEQRVRKQLKGRANIEKSGDILLDMELAPAFFTFEFYPCSPECDNASQIGINMMSTFEREDPKLAEAYKAMQPYLLLLAGQEMKNDGRQYMIDLMDKDIVASIEGKELNLSLT